MGKKNYKILFISLFNGEALGVRILHSILHHEGYDARLLFLKVPFQNRYNSTGDVTEKELLLLEDYIREYKPNLIAFSLVSSVFGLYKRIYERIKGSGEFKIFLGGWQASLNPEECIKYSDIVCVGEGEDALLEVADKLFNNQPVDCIDNIWVKKDNKIIKNPIRPLIQNLSRFPTPVFDDNLSAYIENDELINKEIYKFNTRYGIIAGRGCPYSCTYCSNVYMAKNLYPRAWTKIRYRSPEHVISELIDVKERLPEITRINFYDEVFLPDKDWVKEFFTRYKQEIALPFYCMFFPGTVKEDFLKILKESYLAGVWIGVQSGSEKIRKNIFKRNYKNSVILEQAKLFHQYGISVRYDFIFDNPFETFEESLESVNLMLELPQPFSMNLFSLKYFPHTEITDMALEAGFISKNDFDDERLSDRDQYGIILTDENSDNNFINHLVYYINKLASQSMLDRKEIHEIIDEYRYSKNINIIKKRVDSM